jgi:hypothetical protein
MGAAYLCFISAVLRLADDFHVVEFSNDEALSIVFNFKSLIISGKIDLHA